MARANLPARPRRWRAVALMVGAGIAWSTGGIIVRNVKIDDGFEIVFWRSLFLFLALGAYLLALHGRSAPRQVAACGTPGLLSGLLLAATFFFFILALLLTSVANTLVIMSASPFLAAIFGRVWLGESVRARTWVAMSVGAAGIALMFADSLGRGQVVGNLLALGVSIAFASNVIVLRRAARRVDMAPAVLLAGLFSMAIALPFAWPFEASLADIGWLALMGSFQLALGCVLWVLAARDLSAAEIGLLSLIEVILGPLWVWLGVGERPSELALIGAAVVIGALVANELGPRPARPTD